MDLDETAKLLTVVAAYDNRKVQRETVIVWQQALSHLTLDVAQQAVVLHFKESTAYLLPGHVNAAARRVHDVLERQRRMSRPALEPAAVTLDRAAHEAEFQKALAEYRAARDG
ncbi:hypothetical protein [Curtobacterium sp. USHLN213]|uniref:hypothetical protein n=1 Tax=Curtobacterium sp. USHLN213 TaxID=3081255 RepID=UPI0030173995